MRMCKCIFHVGSWWDRGHRKLANGFKIFARKKYPVTILGVPDCWDWPDESLTSENNWYSIQFDAPELHEINCMCADTYCAYAGSPSGQKFSHKVWVKMLREKASKKWKMPSELTNGKEEVRGDGSDDDVPDLITSSCESSSFKFRR
jgi:hypothetical protein